MSAATSLSAASAPAKPERLTLRPSNGWRALDLREIVRFKDLLLVLAGRDLKLRYKQTLMGVTWVILQPLLAAGIFSFVFGVVAKLPSPTDGVPYFVFSFAGLLSWNVFASTLSKTGVCMTGNAHLVSKVYFPRLILPLSTVLSTLVDLAVALPLLVIMLIVYRISPGWPIVLLPMWILLVVTMALGLGLIAAALTVSYRDVQYLLPLVIPFLMYASPVAYQLSLIPQEFRTAYMLINPLAALIDGFRWSALGGHGTTPQWGWVAYSVGVTLLVLLIGAAVFRRLERRFADVI